MKSFLVLILAIFLQGACQSPPKAKTDSGVPDTASPIKDVSPAEAQAAVSKAYSQFVDVRSPEEYKSGHAARAINIPIDTLSTRMDILEKNEPVYVICETGGRSRQAATMLKDAGYNNVLNVAGGTTAWREAGLPIETRSPHEPAAN